MRTSFFSLYALVLASIALAAPLNSLAVRGKSNFSHAFAADPSLNVEAIYTAVKGATKVADSYLLRHGWDRKTPIYNDWIGLEHVSAWSFMADMDIDCDGVAYDCAGDSSGDRQTSFGALDATKVPWFVLPQRFFDKSPHDESAGKHAPALKENALGAVICDSKMYYAIFGDANGASPQVIGEGSLLLGQICFPEGNISGSAGHDQADVAYIVFANQSPDGIDSKKSTIDLAALKTLGDEQVRLLVQDLNL
ncbi:fungal chitosanase of glycosyl hydrolase group 75-domain-containing protein [Mycena crocata]|nr:fungal chitosanase of glycosyl hydrolase group 75-domain-containing protein [Mycena crocata]